MMMMQQPLALLPSTPLAPPPPNDYQQLYESYKRQLRADKTVFPCPFVTTCQRTQLLSKDYELHCTCEHRLDARYYCVWCRGAVFFRRRHKQKNVLHLQACWRKFIMCCQPTVVQLRRIHPSPKLEHWWNLPARAYDVVWPAPLRIQPLTFKNAALNPAAAAVRLFLETTPTSGNTTSDNTTTHSSRMWYHVTVAMKALTGFLKSMDHFDGRFQTLPHSCWCLVQHGAVRHRHWIVVGPPDDSFLHAIVKPIVPNFIHVDKITRAVQLVNTIGNLSDQRRGWGFSSNRRCPMFGVLLKAYYALEPLPKDFCLPLLMQWDGGVLEDDTYAEKTRDIIEAINMKLKVRSSVSEQFERSFEPTEYRLYFFRGEKLYFKCKRPAREAEPVPGTRTIEIIDLD